MGQKGELAPKQCKGKHEFDVIVILIVFSLLDKGPETDNLQKEWFFNCYESSL